MRGQTTEFGVKYNVKPLKGGVFQKESFWTLLFMKPIKPVFLVYPLSRLPIYCNLNLMKKKKD